MAVAGVTGKTPLVSVMMPCYNAERTLPMALASLQAQTYENWEAVIVDDGSTDRTWALLEACADPRVRRERFPENRGRGAARQRCLEMARGELLSFLDSDDWLFPEKLERQAALMEEHPELSVVSGACVITGAKGTAVGLNNLGAAPGRALTIHRLARPAPPALNFPPCMVRMDAARAAGFNRKFRRAQDKDFLIRVLLGRDYGISA
ncbi:MAG: glycosyltransferase family 2 protein, partial [Elusimicrobia bacterium]|nr:glycosyltransferase family 2 protein [Elusimicrobiota bacterium]